MLEITLMNSEQVKSYCALYEITPLQGIHIYQAISGRQHFGEVIFYIDGELVDIDEVNCEDAAVADALVRAAAAYGEEMGAVRYILSLQHGELGHLRELGYEAGRELRIADLIGRCQGNMHS